MAKFLGSTVFNLFTTMPLKTFFVFENILSAIFKIMFRIRKIWYNFLKIVSREHQPNNIFKCGTYYFLNCKIKTIFKYSYQTGPKKLIVGGNLWIEEINSKFKLWLIFVCKWVISIIKMNSKVIYHYLSE